MRATIMGAILWIICHAAVSGAEPLPRTTPEAVGFDSAQLADTIEELLNDPPGIHSLMIVRKGSVCLDVAFFPFRRPDKHDIASCTKTVTALTLGAVIDAKKIGGPETPITDLFPRRTIAELDHQKKSIRLDDLLTMRSGLFFLQEAITQLQMFQSPDWAQFCLDLKSFRKPGESFQYFNANPHLISAAISDATGQAADVWAKEQIFTPLGVDDFAWPRDPQGISFGWGDLRLTTEGMARLGLLFLHQGVWEGKQIISKEWIGQMTQPHVSSTGNKLFPNYGYQIWIADDVIAFRGRGGQRIWIVPSRDLVAVTTAGVSRKRQDIIDNLLRERILPALKGDSLPSSTQGQERLSAAITRAEAGPKPSAPSPLSELARSIDGVQFDFDPNPYAKSVRIRWKNPSEATLSIALSPIHRAPDLELAVGFDGVPRFSAGRRGERAALLGSWNGNVLTIDFDEVGNINHWTMKLTYDMPSVRLEMSEVTDLPPVRVKGRRVDP